MRFIGVWFRRFMGMKLRMKLIVFYVLLILIPSLVNGLIHYRTSSDIILNNSRESMMEIVKKNNEIIDILLSGIEQRTLSLISDPDLFHLFDRTKPENDLELVRMDKKATLILNKYFGQDQALYSAQLVTSYYSFGGTTTITTNSPYVSVSPQGFLASDIYAEAKGGKGRLIWTPTYDFTEKFNQAQLLPMEPRFRYMFSASRVVNSAPLIDGLVQTLDAAIERPVLLLNFNESFYRSVFARSLSIKGSYFYIVTPQGHVISHPDIGKLGTIQADEVVDQARLSASGTLLSRMNGEEMLVCYDVSHATGWITVSVVPYKELIGNLPVVRYWDLLMTAMSTMLAIVLAYMASGWLTQPIKRLLVAIQLTGSGDFSTKIPEPSGFEFRILIQKFNQMNGRIQDLIRENYEVRLREKEAEIMALNLQLNPHFLYNTLNIINWMAIEKEQRSISRMIVSLSTMLQYTVKNKKEQVRLQDELEWLKSYLHIMEQRFEGVFTVHYELEMLPGDARVPKLFLQPIVENAILHGFESMEHGGLILLSGEQRNGALHFRVEDNGRGMSEESLQALRSPEAQGIGIGNVEQRIKLLYGEIYGLSIASVPGRGTTVTIVIPYER